MVLEKLQEYIDSKEELQKAYNKLRQYGTIIGDVHRYIVMFPYQMTVSNVDVGFPITAEREYTLNGNQWPKAKQIAEALADYLKKRIKSKRLYDSLSDAQRQTIQPHPDM